MSQDKFFIYILKPTENTSYRVFADTTTVKDILSHRGKTGISMVIRSSTNQLAFLLGEDVAWMDIQELSDYRKLVE